MNGLLTPLTRVYRGARIAHVAATVYASYKVPEAERFTQTFCAVCGSKVPRINTQLGYAAIPAGSLDDDPGVRPMAHIYVDSKAAWDEISDELPRYAENRT